MKAIDELGYLTSEYDNYTDILPVEPGKEIDAHHDRLPGAAVLKADGQRMTAWLTWDKKTQYMKRCPALWVPAAKVVVPKALKTHPFLGRFIDVTTAEGLYECYDPEHPLTRAQKRECGVALLELRPVAGTGHRRGARHLVVRAARGLHRRDDERRLVLVARRASAASQVQGPGVHRPWGGKYGNGKSTRSGASAMRTACRCGSWSSTTALSRPGTGAIRATSCSRRRRK